MPFRKNEFWGTTYITVLCLGTAIGISVAVIAGWVFNISLLTTYQNGWASMKVNTALVMIASATALLLSTKYRNPFLPRLLASFVCIIGGLTLSEYLFRWDALIDELFFQPGDTGGEFHPGRMSMATATLATMTGIALLFHMSRNKKGLRIAETLGGICFLTALGSFLGHLYNVTELYKIFLFESISMPTSLSFMLIAAGLFFSKPALGFLAPFHKPTAAARTGLRGALTILAILFILSWLQVQVRRAGWDNSELGSALLVILVGTNIFFLIRWRTVKLNQAEEDKERLYALKRESEMRLNEAQQIAHIGSWDLDITRNSLQWSDEIYRIFEIDPARFGASYESFINAIHPEDKERVNNVYMHSVKNRKPYSIEHRLLFPDGRVKFVSERCKTFYDKKGTPIRSVGTVQDITELKKAEIAVAKNEKRFRDLLESTPDAMVIINERGSILMTNKQACLLFGYTKHELAGQPVEILMPEVFRKRHIHHRERFTQAPKTRVMGKSLELIAVDKQNRQFPVEISLSPLITDEGMLVSAAIRDITERKESEKALAENYHDIRRLTNHLQTIREEERTRIAREIHDELGQQLTVMMMDLSSLEKKNFHNKNQEAQEKFTDLKNLVREAIRSVRRVCSELRPSVLDDLGLETAIDLQLKEFEKRSGIHTHYQMPPYALELTNQEKTSMFRIFQESLTNIARHSGAKNVHVTLERTTKGILMKITDDGIGYEEKGIAIKKTFGILGMQERAAAIGGEYSISGIPGKGTMITVFVPSATINDTP